MPERRVWATAGHQNPPGDGDWDLPPPARRRGRVNQSHEHAKMHTPCCIYAMNPKRGLGLHLYLESHSNSPIKWHLPSSWRALCREGFSCLRKMQRKTILFLFFFLSSGSGFGGSDFRNSGSRNTGSRDSVSGDSRSGSNQGRGRHFLMFIIEK